MKKIFLKSGIGLGLAVMIGGCATLPPVPEFAKAPSQKSSNTTNGNVNMANSTNSERLACEYKYCIANQILDTDKNCLPAKKNHDAYIKPYKGDFDFSRLIDANERYVKQCPHSNTITYPF